MQRSLLDFMGNRSPRAVKRRLRSVSVSSDGVTDVDAAEEPKRASASRRTISPPATQGQRSQQQPVSTTTTTTTTTNSASSSVWLAAGIRDPQWAAFLAPLTADSWRGGQFAAIERFLDAQAAAGKQVFPPRSLIFSAFNTTPFERIKIVLLGQDPYHGDGQANGLCFSVDRGRVPPSLQNMYKELEADVPGFTRPQHGDLRPWAAQGMLMLNASLTVEAHQANSHASCGWQLFTDDAIKRISAQHPNRIVFLLWGNFAKKKRVLIDERRHIVIENAHPSPLSARFWFGCKCFSKCNDALQKLGHTPLDWTLPPTQPRLPPPAA